MEGLPTNRTGLRRGLKDGYTWSRNSTRDDLCLREEQSTCSLLETSGHPLPSSLPGPGAQGRHSDALLYALPGFRVPIYRSLGTWDVKP